LNTITRRSPESAWCFIFGLEEEAAVFRKVLQIAVTLSVLLAAHVGYVRVFTIVEEQLRTVNNLVIIPDSDRVGWSKTGREATELAEKSFGKDHWSTSAPWRVYNAQRGFWLYAETYDRRKDGLQYVFKPFAIIWQSKDKRSLKLLSADEAVMDFDQPVDMIKPGTKPGHVVHAQINNNVQLRDDKGTPDDHADDLKIALDSAEFDERTLQITSDSPVLLTDRDMFATGLGMRIDLRPNEGPGRTGFNGAKSISLLSNVHILVKNARRSGILPGTARGGGPAPDAPTPVDLRCASTARFDLPEPAPPLRPGETPPPPAPTYARFVRNVRVTRGTDQPDQLDCDVLTLTLVPTPKAIQRQDEDDETPAGPLTELTLREAKATGHNVWLQSKAQALVAQGVELIYKKLAPLEADATYFRGDANTRLWIRKIEYESAGEGAERGKIRFIDTIRTTDVTIFENGQGSGFSSVVAHGPGRLETRTVSDGPVVRWAEWQDELDMRPVTQGDQLRRRLSLTGSPRVAESGKMLSAHTSIVTHLRPKPKADDAAVAAMAANTSASASGDSFEMEWVQALDDVRLAMGPDADHPDARVQNVIARYKLDAEFESPPPVEPVAAAAAAAAQPTQAAAVAAQPARARAAAGRPAGGQDQAEANTPPAPNRPAEPAIEIAANNVWVRLLSCPAGQGRAELKEARLRGDVTFHQDPAPDKNRGTDLSGDAADLLSQGEGRARFLVHGRRTADDQLEQPATVSNEEFEIEGPIIGLDQATDVAWVDGPGQLRQMVAKNLLNEQGLGNDLKAVQADSQPAKVPMTVTWRSRMEFHGRLIDRQGRVRPAKAEFFDDVHAKTEDAELFCDDLETFMDRVVSFARPKRDPAERAEAPAADGRAQIAFVRSRSNAQKLVVVFNTKRDPQTSLIVEKQRIQGHDVTYDKRSGQFNVQGEGEVRLYARKGEGGLSTRPGFATEPPKRTVPTAAKVAVPARRVPAPEAKTKSRAPAQAQRKAPAKAQAKTVARPPTNELELTQVQFTKLMRGRFGSGEDAATTGDRQADFQGDVEVIHGPVPNTETELDADRPPREYVLLSSQFLRVISEPPASGSNTPAHNYLNALYNATASSRDQERSEATIQGDQITYDSLKKLFYIYAFEGREVSIVKQNGPGQPPSTASGQSGMYNHGTGQSEMIAPRTFSLIDSNSTGTRNKNIPPPNLNAKPRPKPRSEPRIPPRSNIERRGFTAH
jgi:hypothetical protein